MKKLLSPISFHLRAGVFLSTLFLSTPLLLRAEIPLPTPAEHYDSYDPETEGPLLFSRIFPELEPSQQSLILGLMGGPGSGAEPRPSRDELIAQLQTVDWTRWRPQVLELLLHRSHVLEVVPDTARDWLPIVHDSLLFFLDQLGEERLLERLLNQASVPEDAPRGEHVLQFLAQTPTLQKIGQIFARNPEVPPDLRESLQILENSLKTTSRDQVTQFILQEIGPETMEEYQVHFAEEILAEATVGVILPCTLVLPGETRVREAVAKVIKPYVMLALQEELEIFDRLTQYFAEYSGSYAIGTILISDMFEEIREALSREIQVADEQENLAKAGEYYQHHERVTVPELYPLSTEHVTFMGLSMAKR